jgi:hypothetical protein
MSDAISTLMAHVNRTLPDSIAERRRILAAMLELMTEAHPAHPDVAAELAALDKTIQFQAKAQLRFQTLLK